MKKKIIIIFICLIILVVGIILGKSTKEDNSGNSTNENIASVEELYNAYSTEITPLTKLPEKYTIYDAIEDGCLVLMGNKYNDEPQNEFMELYNKKEKAFTRVAQLTDEGDLVLYDVVYIPEREKVYIISDYTRDEFSAKEDRKISFKEYEKLETNYKNKKCWIAYNGELSSNKDNDIFYIVSV